MPSLAEVWGGGSRTLALPWRPILLIEWNADMFERMETKIKRWARKKIHYMSRDYLRINKENIPADRDRRLRIAVLGTCMAGGVSDAFKALGAHVDDYLFTSDPTAVPPSADWASYDAIVVLPALRALLGGDLRYARVSSEAEFADYMDYARGRLRHFVENISGAVQGRAPVFVLSLPEPSSTYQGILLNNRKMSLHRAVCLLNDELAGRLDTEPSFYYIELNDIVRFLGARDISDEYTSHFSHGGVMGAGGRFFYEALVVRIHQALSILRAEEPIKLIVTDLDNTLWRGVLAEFDTIIPHEHTEGWPIGYAEALLEFKRRGGLLAISSKNDHDETLQRFKTVWGDKLRIDDFCSVKINWKPKSQNIAEILAETNLQAQNVLFVDDNPREIEEVKRALPAIRTLSGDETLWRSHILYSPHTQVAGISTESAHRTQMIAAKSARDEISTRMSREDYLRELEIRVELREVKSKADKDYPRALELINKTNQFNTTGRRWSENDMAGLFAAAGVLVTLRAADKFGDNGLVSVAIVRGPVIEQVVLSCRVFGLGIETALLSHLMHGHGIEAGLLTDTGRNKACAAFYGDHGFTADGDRWLAGEKPGAPAWIAISA